MSHLPYANEERIRLLVEITRLLKKYQAYEVGGPLRLRRIGKDYDGGYVVPELALEQADVILGYGIQDDSSFEEGASAMYGIRSYGFDGSTKLTQLTHKLFHFTPHYIISREEVEKIPGNYINGTSFDDHLHIFHLEEKRLFVKMDIEGNEYTTMPDVLRYSAQITGITTEIHFNNDNELPKALHLLQQLQKDFLLIHLHGHNHCPGFSFSEEAGVIPRTLELSYIHKQLVQHAEISENQKHPTSLDMPILPEYPEIVFEINRNL